MNKEKEIDEVEEIIEETVVICNDYLCGTHEAAENIINVGYRKADEVRKETAKHIKWSIINNLPFDDDAYEIIDEIFAEYGVEVDE